MATTQTMRFRELPALVSGKTDCFMADPRKIVVDPDYNCRDMNSAETLAHIEWLTDSIMQNDFTSELHVIRRGLDVVLRRGHCRLAAALKAIERGKKLEGVPVIQMRGNEELDLLFDQETSNSGLRLDPLARARLVRKARALGVAPDEIARRMNWKSVASVNQHLEMLEMPEPVKDMVRERSVSVTTALAVTKANGAEAPTILKNAKAKVEASGKKNQKVRPRDIANVTGKAVVRQTSRDVQELIDTAGIFARHAALNDLNERGDNEAIEIPVGDLKLAFRVFNKATGGKVRESSLREAFTPQTTPNTGPKAAEIYNALYTLTESATRVRNRDPKGNVGLWGSDFLKAIELAQKIIDRMNGMTDNA